MNVEDVEDDDLTVLQAKESTAGSFKSVSSNSIAKPVKPSSYDMINGSSGSYNYWDESYDGNGNSLQNSSSLSGGLGDLTDGVVPTDNWHVVEQPTGPGPYVGWQSNPSIEFNFDRSIQLDAFKIYVDDSNGHGGVSVPASVTLTTSSGSFSSGTLSDPSYSQPTSYHFSGLDLQGSKFTLNINRSSQWVFVSEVEFFEAKLPVDGLYGDLELGADGSYNYVVDNTNTTVNALSESDSLDDVFIVQISDGNGGLIDQTVEFSIDGTNDKPILSITSTTAFTEDASTNQVGSLVAAFTVTDPESDSLTIALSDTTHYALSSNSNRVLLTSEGLAKVNNGEPLPSFTLQASDGSLSSSLVTVAPTVTAVNDAPLGRDGSITLDEDTVYSFQLSDFPLNDEEDSDDSITNIKLVNMPGRGHLLLNDKPLESVYTINFENSSLSDWDTLGDVSIRSTSSQSYGPASFDASVAESSYVLLSTISSKTVTQIEDFLGLSRGLLNPFLIKIKINFVMLLD